MKHDFNTLHLLWAIRNIPSSLVNIQERMILMVLLSCAGTDNRSWHSQASLAEMCSLSETSIKKYIKTLVQKKFILIHNPTVYGRSICNHYELVIDHLMSFSREQKGSRDATFSGEKGSRRDEKGSRGDYERGRGATTKKEIKERKKKGAQDGSLEPPASPVCDESEYIPCPPHIKKKLDDLFNRFPKTKTAH